MTITRVGEVRCKVGEGPLWDVEEGALYFVDIRGQELYRHGPSKGELDRWDLPLQIGCMALREQGGAVLGLADGVYSFDFGSGEVSLLAKPERPSGQLNDGKVDRQGRFVVGTAVGFSSPEPRAAFFRLDADKTLSLCAPDFYVTNGPAWSPDGSTFYAADSKHKAVFAYDYDTAAGTASNRREFFHIGDLGEAPDGGTVDSEGCYWTTAVQGGKIIRIAPNGSIRQIVDTPVPWPSSVMFGGADLDRLYFTSIDGATYGMPSTPESGGLYVIDGLGVKGVPEARYRG